VELSPAGRRLRAALSAVLVPAYAPELALVHRWLDSWSGIGLVSAGMHRAGWDLQSDPVRHRPLAGDVLGDRAGAFDHGRLGLRMRAVAGGAARGVGSDHAARSVPARWPLLPAQPRAQLDALACYVYDPVTFSSQCTGSALASAPERGLPWPAFYSSLS
jgi:hypothetical protein